MPADQVTRLRLSRNTGFPQTTATGSGHGWHPRDPKRPSPCPHRRRRTRAHRTAVRGRHGGGPARLPRGRRVQRVTGRARLRPARRRARRDAARPRRPPGAPAAALREPEAVRPHTHGPGRARAPYRRTLGGRGRLRDQAVLPGGGRPAAARTAVPLRRRGEQVVGRRRSRAGRARPQRGDARGAPRRYADPADRQGVRTARPAARPPAPGAEQGPDPGPPVEQLLRRRRQPGGGLHLRPPPQDRQGQGADDPHGARTRIRDQGGEDTR